MFRRILCVFLIWIGNAALAKTPACVSSWSGPARKNDVRCRPSSFQGIPDTAPTGALFVALLPGQNEFIVREINEIRKKYAPMARLNVLVDRPSLSHLDNVDLPPDFFKSDDVHLIPVHFSIQDGLAWVQDYMQFVSIAGAPALFRNTYEGDNWSTPSRGADPTRAMGAQIAKACGMKQVRSEVFGTAVDTGSVETMGGNWEVMPGGAWYTSYPRAVYRKILKGWLPKDYPKTAARSIPKDMVRTMLSEVQKIRSSGTPVVRLDTSFASVGHVDEVVSFVKTTQPAPCDFAILAASPATAYRLLDRMHNGHPNSKKCREISKSGELNPGPRTMRALTAAGCFGLSGKTVLQIKSDRALRLWNERAQRRMRWNLKRIRSALKTTTGCRSPKVVNLPVVFGPRTSFEANGPLWLANPVNGVTITPSRGSSFYLWGKTYLPAFDQFIEKALQKIHVPSKSISSEPYRVFRGGLHCATNTVSVCRP